MRRLDSLFGGGTKHSLQAVWSKEGSVQVHARVFQLNLYMSFLIKATTAMHEHASNFEVQETPPEVATVPLLI